MADAVVTVDGLAAFRRGLGEAGKNLERQLKKGADSTAARIIIEAKPRIRALPSPGGRIAVEGLHRVGSPGVAAGIALDRSNPTLMASIFGASSHTGRKGPGFSQLHRYTRGEGRIPWQPWMSNQPWEESYGLGPAITKVLDRDMPKIMFDRMAFALRDAFPGGSW